jgi:hypothetical protein
LEGQGTITYAIEDGVLSLFPDENKKAIAKPFDMNEMPIGIWRAKNMSITRKDGLDVIFITIQNEDGASPIDVEEAHALEADYTPATQTGLVVGDYEPAMPVATGIMPMATIGAAVAVDAAAAVPTAAALAAPAW